ncbi:MFS transporter [Candidatus Saccharibacteria bacterium]|nr:MFS transporter [Candidatus Saccharibacteria bacterium]
MIRRLLNRMLAPRHPWRVVGFSEISEMYLSSFLRTFSIGMVGVFVPIYLYKNGYSITAIFLYYTLFYSFGIIADYLVAHLIAKIGPKHVMRMSFLVQMLFSVLLIHINNIPYALVLLALTGCIGSTLYFISYHVDFSKIKNPANSGKEQGYMEIMQRSAAVLGPIAGGLLATFVSPVATFAASAIALFIATLILMLSPEPVRTKQIIRFKGLGIRKHWRDYASFSAMCGEGAISLIVWPIFLSLVVFTSNIYLRLGFVSSVSVLIAIVVALPLGRLLDNKKGHAMIQYGTGINALVSIMRIGVTNMFGALFVAFVNEPNTLVYRIAFFKGYYDRADDYPGYRIAFLTSNEMIADALRALTFFSFTLASLHYSPYIVCSGAFILAAVYSFCIRLERFPALKK